MKIWQKILLGFLLVFVLISISGVVTYLGYERILDSFHALQDEELLDSEAVQEMEKTLLEMDAFILKFYVTGDDRALRRFQENRERWHALFGQIRGSLVSETRFSFRLGRIKQTTEDWMNKAESAARRTREGTPTLLPTIEPLRRYYRELLMQQRLRLNESYDSSLKIVEQGSDLAWGLRALALVVGLITCLAVIRSVKKPLDRLTDATEKMAAGTFEPIQTVSKDELGRLTEAFNQMSRALKERTEALEDQRRLAVQANELKTEFLTNTSHELRTPLNTIMGYSQLVLEGLARSREEERNYLATIQSSAKHLLSIINDVLDIARIESGQMSLVLEPVRVRDVFGQVEDHMRLPAQEKGIQLAIIPPESDLWVQAHPARLNQVLLNLVGNAVKFTNQGRIEVLAKADEPAGNVCFIVRDTGVGIPLEKQGRLFQKFVQADGSMTRHFGGTGLGLALSKTLLELMHGSIRLESEGEGRGATAIFTLKREKDVG